MTSKVYDFNTYRKSRVIKEVMNNLNCDETKAPNNDDSIVTNISALVEDFARNLNQIGIDLFSNSQTSADFSSVALMITSLITRIYDQSHPLHQIVDNMFSKGQNTLIPDPDIYMIKVLSKIKDEDSKTSIS